MSLADLGERKGLLRAWMAMFAHFRPENLSDVVRCCPSLSLHRTHHSRTKKNALPTEAVRALPRPPEGPRIIWTRRRDSNPHTTGYEPVELPVLYSANLRPPLGDGLASHSTLGGAEGVRRLKRDAATLPIQRGLDTRYGQVGSALYSVCRDVARSRPRGLAFRAASSPAPCGGSSHFTTGVSRRFPRVPAAPAGLEAHWVPRLPRRRARRCQRLLRDRTRA